jgi:hypothetical protein
MYVSHAVRTSGNLTYERGRGGDLVAGFVGLLTHELEVWVLFS